MIFGDLGDLTFPDICLTGEEKPLKNLTQETCLDWGSNPGPLRDKCACYHLFHSGGLTLSLISKINILLFKLPFEIKSIGNHCVELIAEHRPVVAHIAEEYCNVYTQYRLVFLTTCLV